MEVLPDGTKAGARARDAKSQDTDALANAPPPSISVGSTYHDRVDVMPIPRGLPDGGWPQHQHLLQGFQITGSPGIPWLVEAFLAALFQIPGVSYPEQKVYYSAAPRGQSQLHGCDLCHRYVSKGVSTCCAMATAIQGPT